MARARNIKPSFFANEILVEMEAFDRLLFIGLWCLADREGRIEDRPKRIKMELFPCDAYDVSLGLDALHQRGFIKRYAAAGMSVIAIEKFHKHQTPHGTEKDSELPDENGSLTIHDRLPNGYVSGRKRINNVKSATNNGEAPLKNSADPVAQQGGNTLNPDSLNPDSLNPEREDSASLTAPSKRTSSNIAKPDGVSDSVWSDFLKHRVVKKARLTQTALDGIVTQAAKAGWTLQDALAECCTRGWTGFKADWVAGDGRVHTGAAGRNAAAARTIFGHAMPQGVVVDA